MSHRELKSKRMSQKPKPAAREAAKAKPIALPLPPRPVGRPTKLNGDMQKRIHDALVMGATYEAAAIYGGISYDAFNEWMRRTEPEYIQFRQLVEEANSQCQVGYAANIRHAALGGDWRAAAWMLERRFAKSYAQRIGAIDDKEIDDAIRAELAKLADERQTADAGGNEAAHPIADATSGVDAAGEADKAVS